jgi:hypothetical protein
MSITPRAKAIGGTLIIALAGIIGGYFAVATGNEVNVQLSIFYIVLAINTFFSIELFASIVSPRSRIQKIMDAILLVLIIGLAFTLNNPLLFIFLDLIMFLVATVKYTLMLGVVDHPKLLKRKIIIDLSGALLAGLALVGILYGYQSYSVWILTSIFLLANIFFLFVWPMYRADR